MAGSRFGEVGDFGFQQDAREAHLDVQADLAVQLARCVDVLAGITVGGHMQMINSVLKNIAFIRPFSFTSHTVEEHI